MKKLLVISSSILALTLGLASTSSAAISHWGTDGTICATVNSGPDAAATRVCPGWFSLTLRQVPLPNNFTGRVRLYVTVHYECNVLDETDAEACLAIQTASRSAGCHVVPICERPLALYFNGQRVRRVDLRSAPQGDLIGFVNGPNWDYTFDIGTFPPIKRVGWNCLQVGMRSDQVSEFDPVAVRSPALWVYTPPFSS